MVFYRYHYEVTADVGYIAGKDEYMPTDVETMVKEFVIDVQGGRNVFEPLLLLAAKLDEHFRHAYVALHPDSGVVFYGNVTVLNNYKIKLHKREVVRGIIESNKVATSIEPDHF